MPTCQLAFTKYILGFLHLTSIFIQTIVTNHTNLQLERWMMGQICDLETVEPQEIHQGLRNVL